MGATGKKQSLPSKFAGVVSAILIGGLVFAAVRNSIIVGADDPLYPDLAAALFGCGIIAFFLAFMLGRKQLQQIGLSVAATPGDITLEPLRLRATLTLIGLVAITPELYFWARDWVTTNYSSGKVGFSLWAIFGYTVLLDLLFLWGVLRHQSPLVISRMGIQYPDEWIGILPWRDVKDAQIVQSGRIRRFAICFFKPTTLQLKKRTYIFTESKVDKRGTLLTLPGVGGRIPVDVMVSIVQERAARYGHRNSDGNQN